MKTRLAVVLGTLLGMASCGLDVEGMKETNPDGGTPLELTVSASDGTIVLNERQSEETALGLSWTTGSNYGTGNAIEYILDIDLADGDWIGCYTENLGRRVYSRDITVEELNTILTDELETVPGSETGFKVRVTASVVDCPDLVQTSEAKCSATTYRPVSMSLFMTTGGAGAWNASENIEMTRSSAGIFTAEAIFDACEFIFNTTDGNAWPAYVRDNTSDNGEGTFNAIYSETAPAGTDYMFSIREKSFYRITVNLFDLTVSIEDILSKTLYLIGDATPGGWSLDNLSEMEMTGKGQFTWTGTLSTAGEGFKFVTTRNFWPGYVKATEDPDDYSLEYFASDPGSTSGEDLKFKVSEVGEYTVNADLINMTVSYSKTGEAEFNTLYIIGDATPGGWDNNKATEMEPAGDGTYSWTGELNAGSFRFIVTPGTFNPGYWKANDNPDDMSIVYSETGLSGADDRSFSISEAGNYTITADTEALVISIRNNGGSPEPQPEAFEAIWLIGDASPASNGWSLDDAETNDAVKMKPSSDNPYLFSWTGSLKNGELKFSCDLQRDWNGIWYMPETNGKTFTETSGETILLIDKSLPENSSIDNKWKVTAGDYTITVNQLTSTMTVTRN